MNMGNLERRLKRKLRALYDNRGYVVSDGDERRRRALRGLARLLIIVALALLFVALFPFMLTLGVYKEAQKKK